MKFDFAEYSVDVPDTLWEQYKDGVCNVDYRITTDGLIPLTSPEIASTRKVAMKHLAEYSKYLADTDYIITKLNECAIEYPEQLDELRAEYAEQLQARRRCREEINKIQDVYINPVADL